MEEQKNNGQAEACNCGWCHHGGRYNKHPILRMLLAVIVLGIVFCLGVKAGELKGAFGYRHGFRNNDRGYYMTRPGTPYPGMMYYNNAYGSSTAPATPPQLQQQ